MSYKSAERGLSPVLNYPAGYSPAGIRMLSGIGVGLFMDYYGRAIGVKYRMLLVSLQGDSVGEEVGAGGAIG